MLSKSINKSNRGYDTDVMKLLIDQEQSRVSMKTSNQIKFDGEKIKKLENIYFQDFFNKWAKKAHEEEDSKDIGDVESSIGNFNTFPIPSQTKQKNKYENLSKAESQPMIKKK